MFRQKTLCSAITAVTVSRFAMVSALLIVFGIAANSTAQQQQKNKDQDSAKQEFSGDEDGKLKIDLTKEPTLPEIDAPSTEEINESIQKGVEFLLKDQNKDGSWGSHDAQRPFQVYAPVPGAHHAFRSAVTAMCISALLESSPENEKAIEAVDKAEKWLIDMLPRLRRATGDALYNVWGHAYAIQALVRLHNREGVDDEHKTRLKRLIADQMEMLDRYESVDGGWGYYDFRAQARKPTGSSTSFVNATVLVAYKEAAEIGVQPNQKTVDRAIAATKRQQKKDFTYLYGEYLDKRPQRDINRPGGSLGRSQACNIALRMWGDQTVNDLVLKNWLYRLYVRNGWLSIGRKRPIPHESWFAVAGYFYYYGHYYAAYCIEALPEDQRPPYQGHLAKIIMAYQESNGSWWDYPFYGYHRPYGTAFSIMTLDRCLPE